MYTPACLHKKMLMSRIVSQILSRVMEVSCAYIDLIFKTKISSFAKNFVFFKSFDLFRKLILWSLHLHY